MCGRYFMDADDVREYAADIDSLNRAASAGVDICPGMEAPALVSEGGNTAVRAMHWGFERPSGGGLIINARVETIAEKPLFRAPRTAYFVHGENGLGNVDLPESDAPVEQMPAWDALYEAAKAAKGELVLVAIGPLTNVALALSKHGSLPKLLKRIVIMGGSATYGNATPAAEANIFCDAEAASTVFQCGVPIVMCGLDMTLKTVMSSCPRRSWISWVS